MTPGTLFQLLSAEMSPVSAQFWLNGSDCAAVSARARRNRCRPDKRAFDNRDADRKAPRKAMRIHFRGGIFSDIRLLKLDYRIRAWGRDIEQAQRKQALSYENSGR